MARPRLPLDEIRVIERYRDGETLQEIAMSMQVDRSRVTRVVDEAGLRAPSNVLQLPTPRRVTPPGTIDSLHLVERAGITYRQLDYWTRTGLLTPLGKPTPGSGMSRYYPIEQVNRAAILRWLLAAGINLQTCRAVIDDLMATGHARLTTDLTIHLPEDV